MFPMANVAEFASRNLMYLPRGKTRYPTAVVKNLRDDVTRRSVAFAFDNYNVAFAIQRENVNPSTEVGSNFTAKHEYIQPN